MPISYSLRGSNGLIAFDASNNPVGVINPDGTVNRFSPKTFTSFAGVSATSVASTFGAVGSYDSNSGSVRLNGTGAHGLTTAAIITPAINTGVYVTWTGGNGVSGVYPVTALDVDTSGTKITINLPYVAGTITCTAGTPGVVNYTAHGRVAGDAIKFTTTGTLPTQLQGGGVFYVKSVTSANSFTVASTVGGTDLTFDSAGSGTHTCTLWYGSAAVIAAGSTVGTNTITLASFTVEGNTLTTGGNIEANGLFSITSSANNKVLSISYGASDLYNSGNLTTTTTVNVNKIAWARGTGTVVTSPAAATGHGTATTAYQALTLAYTTDLTLAFKTMMATANEVTTLQGYQVAVS